MIENYDFNIAIMTHPVAQSEEYLPKHGTVLNLLGITGLDKFSQLRRVIFFQPIQATWRIWHLELRVCCERSFLPSSAWLEFRAGMEILAIRYQDFLELGICLENFLDNHPHNLLRIGIGLAT